MRGTPDYLWLLGAIWLVRQSINKFDRSLYRHLPVFRSLEPGLPLDPRFSATGFRSSSTCYPVRICFRRHLLPKLLLRVSQLGNLHCPHIGSGSCPLLDSRDRSNGRLGWKEAQELQEGVWKGLPEAMGHVPLDLLDFTGAVQCNVPRSRTAKVKRADSEIKLHSRWPGLP